MGQGLVCCHRIAALELRLSIIISIRDGGLMALSILDEHVALTGW